MTDAEFEYDRLREKLGREICDNEPGVSIILHRLRYEDLPTEEALFEMVRYLHGRMQHAEDTILIDRLNQPPPPMTIAIEKK